MIIIIHQTSKMLRNYYGSVIFLEFLFFSFARLWNIRSPGRPKVVHVEREEERNGGEEEEVRETGCVWIDTKQLSAVVDPIQLNLRMWTGGGSGGGEV
jgi:hypothetical protein